MAGRKLEHFNEVIQQKLGTILIQEAADPRFRFVTVTGVMLAKDFSFARVNFCCLDQSLDVEQLTESLNKAAGFFSQALARTLTTRKTPRLRFYYDHGYDYAGHIDALLREVKARGE